MTDGHVLLYDDAHMFGGHEVMAVEAAAGLARDPLRRVGFMYFAGNDRLRAALERSRSEGARLELHPLPWCSQSLQGLRTRFQWRRRRELARRLAALRPGLIVAVQGTIEVSTLGVVAAADAGIPVASYVPNGHSLRHMKVRGGALRDLGNRHYYRLPLRFVTISRSMRDLLVHRGVPADRIAIVHNGVRIPAIPPASREAARRSLGIPVAGFLAAQVGRISFVDKAHDIVVRALRLDPGGRVLPHVLFVGDGPDRDRLRRMVETHGLGGRVSMLPWSDDVESVYAAVDMLLLPSRFEGVPLVMLEAMARGVPVAASAVDGMAEFLPQEWQFPAGDAAGLLRTVGTMRSADQSLHVRRNSQLVAAEFSPERLARDLVLALNLEASPTF